MHIKKLYWKVKCYFSILHAFMVEQTKFITRKMGAAFIIKTCWAKFLFKKFLSSPEQAGATAKKQAFVFEEL